jgi:CheY-like chemotaxis protein
MQGDLGLDLAKEHHPDLILLDVNLPDLSTAEFLSSLLSSPSQKNTRIVLLGTDLDTPEFLALNRIHEFELLPKPYEPEALLKILKDFQPRKT